MQFSRPGARRSQFHDLVLAAAAAIPAGETLSYSQVAWLAGNPAAARAAGAVLKTNFDPNIHCHRVIRANGATGGYNRGPQRKIELLLTEASQIN